MHHYKMHRYFTVNVSITGKKLVINVNLSIKEKESKKKEKLIFIVNVSIKRCS